MTPEARDAIEVWALFLLLFTTAGALLWWAFAVPASTRAERGAVVVQCDGARLAER